MLSYTNSSRVEMCSQKFSNEQDLSVEDMENVLAWEKYHHRWERKVHERTPHDLLKHMTPIGRSWVMGYTNELNRLTTDMSDRMQTKNDVYMDVQEEEVDHVLHVLARSNEQNVLILGKAGVGKRTLVENVIYKLRTFEQEHSLPYTRFLLLHTEQLISGTANADNFLLQALERARKSGRFVLVIENISVILNSGNTNLIAVLSKFLDAPNISLIAIADTPGLSHAYQKRPSARSTL